MKTVFKISVILITFIFFGCKKPIREFIINSDNRIEIAKFYADSTYTLESDEIKYSGNWTGGFNEGDTITISPTMFDYNIMTATPKESFEIIDGQLTRFKKSKFKKRQKLSKSKKQVIDIPFYGKIELFENKRDSINIFNGGDCGGNITQYKITKNYITIDTTSCGDYGDTYTKYILDSLNQSIQLVFKEELKYIKDGKILSQLLINFNERPVISKTKIDTIYSDKTKEKKIFKNDTITDILASNQYWDKLYKEIWTYENFDE